VEWTVGVKELREIEMTTSRYSSSALGIESTYTKLTEKTSATVIPIGIGQQLDHVMDAIHAAGVSEKMRGLTLFVTDASGFINYSGTHWCDITAQNSKSYREAVLEKDWSEVEFMFANAGNDYANSVGSLNRRRAARSLGAIRLSSSKWQTRWSKLIGCGRQKPLD
jgi:hypothetical protein